MYARTLDKLLLTSAARHSKLTALVDANRSITYSELVDESVNVQTQLTLRGIGRLDRVAVLAEDVVEVMPAYFGTWLAGATAVHLNARLAPAEIEYILEDAQPKLLLFTPGLRNAAFELSNRSGVEPLALDHKLLRSAQHAGLDADQVHQARPEDIAVIGYTSGTTGRPKGAMATHDVLTLNCRVAPSLLQIPHRSSTIFAGSVSFVATLWSQVFTNLHLGGSIRFMGKYNVDEWFEAMRRDRSTWTYIPSPHLNAFTERLTADRGILKHLSAVMHTGSTATPADIEAAVRAMNGRFVEAYGSTEVVAPATCTAPWMYRLAQQGDPIFASAGYTNPSATVTIRREDGSIADIGEIGQICVRSDVGFSGYLNDEAKTAETLVDGEIRMSDMGHFDELGRLFVSGRQAELIVSGGMNIYPAEVERVIKEHPLVVDAAVIGVAHERWGQTVCAIVVTRPDAQLHDSDIIEWSKSRLASYKKPTNVVFVDSLPTTTSNKLDRRRLTAEYSSSTPR